MFVSLVLRSHPYSCERSVYDDGPDALRLRRLQRLKELGLVPQDVEPHPVVGETKEWNDRTPEEKSLSSRSMECFAGMVECIDVNVGKVSRPYSYPPSSRCAQQTKSGQVVDYLESIGELDNTFVCFMSDNGAEGSAYEAYPMIMASSLMDHLKEYYDNSLENLGNGNSFIWYGERWAQASTAPSRLYKAWTTEGGIRVPFVVKYPKQFEPSGGEASKNIIHSFATVMDLAPTIIEMAGLKHPAPEYKGREVVHMRGKSMVPFLRDGKQGVHDIEFVEGWETCGRAAIRKGDWKALWMPKPKGMTSHGFT
jgi:arylsulfatase A-like enzyme